ncbi:uncharacterized protein LOC111078442 [Drosophila obscura]|uniref:uncharacterized protein LOC111078442 n=1 Tax=Drosophila obscura TaxID=7282 RepID=UPI000BA04A0C|nr:uncharacterized protein LOC111078442 [Drosophila obscura]
MPRKNWILFLQILLIFYAFDRVAFGIEEKKITDEIKHRLMSALSEAGYTIKSLGSVGETIGDAISHGSRLPKSVYDIFGSLFEEGELEAELEKQTPVCGALQFKCKFDNIFG